MEVNVKMPAQDGTGPMGGGPLTGRGLGPCGRGFGLGRGFRGRGFGIGRGFGRGFAWRGRMTPVYRDQDIDYPTYPTYPREPTKQEEKEALKEEKEYLERGLKEIIKRLKELK